MSEVLAQLEKLGGGGVPQFTAFTVTGTGTNTVGTNFVVGDIYILTLARSGTSSPVTITSGATTILNISQAFNTVTVTTIVAVATSSTIKSSANVGVIDAITVS